MITTSVITQLDTATTLCLRYKGYSYLNYQQDTNLKVIIYKILNNYNQLPGYCKVSKTAVYYNEGTNHDQPYIKVYDNNISTGFIDCSKVWMNGTNKFSGDTLITNFHVKPTSGPEYDMKNKYLKQ